jgi:hypothetical protein
MKLTLTKFFNLYLLDINDKKYEIDHFSQFILYIYYLYSYCKTIFYY